MSNQRSSEYTPLLQDHNSQQQQELVQFDKDGDEANPREWPLMRKYIQTLQVFLIALIGPMTSDIISPAVDDISKSFGTSSRTILAGQSVFVCMLGFGPLIHAPMSETFGRRNLFVVCFGIFTLLQIPCALVPNAPAFVVFRLLSGFFGSVGVANGGGSIFDMFETHERAMVLGFYLVAPLLGPSLGPLIGGLVIGSLEWQWIFWIVMIAAGVMTVVAYFFLYETNAKVILDTRKQELSKKNPNVEYSVEGASHTSIPRKVAQASIKAVRILFTQPIVATLSTYQALVVSSMFSLYAQYDNIWSQRPYNFTSSEVGLAYLGPVVGFIIAAIFAVAFVDKIYNYYSEKNQDKGLPEYRLPFANIGAVLLPISLFWFGWTIEIRSHWVIPIAATVLFGASQASIFNPVQTYYIDSFEENAASAIAAGAFLRSMLGGLVPLFVGQMFDKLGYGWGMSVFGFLSIMLMPAPLLFQKYGKTLREKFPFKA